MALVTYNDLLTAMVNWLQRSDITALYPDFVTLFEVNANQKLRTRLQTVVIQQVCVNNQIPLPADYQAVIRLRILEGRRFEDVGKCMDRSAEAARKLFGRALTELWGRQPWRTPVVHGGEDVTLLMWRMGRDRRRSWGGQRRSVPCRPPTRARRRASRSCC